MKITPKQAHTYEAIRYDSNDFTAMQEAVRESFNGELQLVGATKALIHEQSGGIPLWVKDGEYIIVKGGLLLEVINEYELNKNYDTEEEKR